MHSYMLETQEITSILKMGQLKGADFYTREFTIYTLYTTQREIHSKLLYCD